MTQRLAELIPLSLSCIILPLAYLALYLRHKSWDNFHRSPTTEILFRSPGESLREGMRKLEELLAVFEIVFFGLPFIVWLLSYALQLTNWIWIIVIIIEAAIYQSLWKNLQQYWRSSRGFDAEREVGEELNQLMHLGYWVYHDFKCQKDKAVWNIDHVVVCQKGIFVVETKSRSRAERIMLSGLKDQVEYNGQRIIYPNGSWDGDAIRQSRNNAMFLRELLEKATGESKYVVATVALPGWQVRDISKQMPNVFVLNPKRFAHFIANYDGSFGDERLKKIVGYLNQECRAQGAK